MVFMKRCPQCQFIYPDSDSVCDFDQTPLVAAAESEIAAITNTPARPALSDLAATHSRKFENRKTRKALPIAAGLGLALGVVVFGVYFAVQRQMKPPQSQVQASSSATPQPVVAQVPSPLPSPSISESPTPEEPSNTAAKASSSPAKTSTSHSTTSLAPVSTSNPAATQKTGTKSVILLTSGGKVEADEVWRTKDGVWYRRDGVVTLLKKNRVKAIVSK
jgi:cytoskeletal protein RodZ